jgi:hypothetical protein
VAHAIGCIGSSTEMRSKAKPKMTPEQREANRKLVPPLRNQNRKVCFVRISRDGESPKVRAVRLGHAHHVSQALIFAQVDMVRNEKGNVISVTVKKNAPKVTRAKVIRRPAAIGS